MLTCPRRLEDSKGRNELHERVDPGRLCRDLDDAVVRADIEDFAAKLVGHEGDGSQMLVLVTKRLTDDQIRWVEVFPQRVLSSFLCHLVPLGLRVFLFRLWHLRHLAMVGQQLLKVLGTEDRDLGEQQLTLDERRLGVVEHRPDRDQILELASCLLNHSLLTLEHNRHARKVLYLGVAHHQSVDVEDSSCENPRHPGQHTGLILYQAVEDMALRRDLRGEGSFVEDVADGSRRRPGGRSVFGGERCDSAVEGLVGERERRAVSKRERAGRSVSSVSKRDRGRRSSDMVAQSRVG
jgi:hypothetical protein